MKKLVYIHGLFSSGRANTARSLAQHLSGKIEVIAPDVPMDVNQALEMLQELCKKHQPDMIVGSSMGGMWAQKLHGYKKILVNPAFHVSEMMRKNIGIQNYLGERKDGINTFEITQELCDNYQKLESSQFDHLSDEEKEMTWAMFGNKDKQVNCSQEYMQHYKNSVLFEGEHSLSEEVITQVLIPLINKVI